VSIAERRIRGGIARGIFTLNSEITGGRAVLGAFRETDFLLRMLHLLDHPYVDHLS
jgi:hypothetical protein